MRKATLTDRPKNLLVLFRCYYFGKTNFKASKLTVAEVRNMMSLQPFFYDYTNNLNKMFQSNFVFVTIRLLKVYLQLYL